VDAIVFIGEEIDDAVPFIFKACRKLKFLGLKLKRGRKEDKVFIDLTTADSLIKVFCLKYNKWDVLADCVKEGQYEKKINVILKMWV